jgi:hypothetical protein
MCSMDEAASVKVVDQENTNVKLEYSIPFVAI